MTLARPLSPRSRKNFEYKTEKRQTGKRTVAGSCIDSLEGYDLFAKSVVNFNMRGRQKITSRVGLFLSFVQLVIVFYYMLSRLAEVSSYRHIQTFETLSKNQSQGRRLDVTQYL